MYHTTACTTTIDVYNSSIKQSHVDKHADTFVQVLTTETLQRGT